MKVLYFHQHFVTPQGAGGIRSYAMARKLLERGHRVTMVCGSMGGGDTGLSAPFVRGMRRGWVDGIEVIELDLPYSNSHGFLIRASIFLKFALRSVVLALREPYDVVFATTTPLTAGIPGIVARWLRGKRFVFEVRDLWPELPREIGVISNPVVLGMMSVLEWLSYKSAHLLVGLSPGIVDGIARLGIDRNRIALIPNGCDLDIFSDKSDPWRPKAVADGDLMAVYAGTQGVANGLDAVLDAAAILKNRGREDIKFVLIGDGRLTPQLKARKGRERLDNVLFLDRVNKASLSGLMARTDIGMQILANVPAFYYGTSPNKFFDYIASGLPVLNNYPGWLAEMIRENNCGFAVPSADPEAFADAMERAASQRDRLKAMGENSRRLAGQEFDRNILAGRFVEWLERALK
jgi:glycosyltransferase involved in cell wall biosynthesis